MSQYGDRRSQQQQQEPKKRTLQIRLGRPRPSTDVPASPSPAGPATNGRSQGLRISLKRKASVVETPAVSSPLSSRPRRAPQSDDDRMEEDDDDDEEASGDNEEVEEDQEEEEVGQQRGHINVRGGLVESADASTRDGSDEEEDEGDDADQQDDDDDDDNDDEDQEQDDDNGASSRASPSQGMAASSASRVAGGPSRRPIKRLRAKGLYDALPRLIENLMRRDSYKFFCEPVNLEDVPNYLEFIKTPMDFGTMKKKIEAREYSHMDQFRSDFQLVIDNAQTYNPPGTLYYNEARRLGAWGSRAIEREGMAVNDNGHAGIVGDRIRQEKRQKREQEAAAVEAAALAAALDQDPLATSSLVSLSSTPLTRSSQHLHLQQPQTPLSATGPRSLPHRNQPRISLGVGIEALMEAARMNPQARYRAAVRLGLAGESLTREGSTLPELADDPSEVGEAALGSGARVKTEDNDGMDVEDDSDDEDEDAGSDAGAATAAAEPTRQSIPRDSRERSVTAEAATGSVPSRRIGSSQPGGTPSTPSGYRHASPDALRKRLAAVTGTPVHMISSPLGPAVGAALGVTSGGGSSRATGKNAKQKHRLGAPGTPKRIIAAARSATGTASPAALGTQLAAALAQAQTQAQASSSNTGVAGYSFDDDGSINADDIEDLKAFMALRGGRTPILMPSIESLHPLAFVPSDYANKTSGGTANSADKAKDDDDDEEEDGKAEAKVEGKEKEKTDVKDGKDDGKGDTKDDGRERGDRDPLSTVPPLRPGAPDPLYSAIAPEPEELSSNWSHEIETLPPHLRNLPFYVPTSLAASVLVAPPGFAPASSTQRMDQSHGTKVTAKSEVPAPLTGWSNRAYEDSLKNEKKPKKQKDKELEKERETLEDWTYFRPRMQRLLELTDLGPFSTVAARLAGPGHVGSLLSTELLSQEVLDQLSKAMERKSDPYFVPSAIRHRYMQAARGVPIIKIEESAMGRDGNELIQDMVYAGIEERAYIRSIAEFVSGAIDTPLRSDDVDDRFVEAEARQEYEWQMLRARSVSVDSNAEEARAARRGPFMWRDASEGPGDATPSEAVDEAANVTSMEEVDSTAASNNTGALTDVEKAANTSFFKELMPLDRPLAEVIENDLIRPMTGNTLDVLHLVAAYLKTEDASALDLDQIEKRLLQSRVVAHPFRGPSAPGVPPGLSMAQNQPREISSTPAPPAMPTAHASTPQPAAPIPFSAETEWLKDQPSLTQLLDEAHQDVDSLGTILQYIINNA
ncbi:hypothetical protein BCV70DRAFT_199128 [Testicularia cyperi]|uniref:Bromo domain-containing protein n=1 Tax=Testicularia cyperi TaxID=1882483 RepID=A0A317XUG8_9BASI|nr:hypothetical protein BCV70DRAFT_199128 [Testicularia cyperi]